ncbi:MAG: GLPGLI family protein [Flavobacteriaceae bacterium]
MKYTISIFFSVLSMMIVNAQNDEKTIVTYDIQYNTELPNVKQGTLEISGDGKESVFLITSNNKNNKRAQKRDDGSLAIMSASSKKRFIYFNYNTDTIYSTAKFSSKEYLVAEKKPTIKWILVNETKTIGSLQVQKATTKFRGRNYVAWYSLDYPLKFGPWKFQGLPGLIVEIYDDTNRYHWILRSIKSHETSFAFQIDKKKYKEISLKGYVDERYNKKPNFVIAKLPRGAKVTSTTRGPRNSIEIEFEWEKEKR